MGRTLKDKQAMVAEIKETLTEAQLVLAIDYQGLTVAEITDLRRRLRPSGTVCKISKNTLMGIAIDGQDNWQPMTELLKGSLAFLLVKEDISGAIKAYQDFQKASKKNRAARRCHGRAFAQRSRRKSPRRFAIERTAYCSNCWSYQWCSNGVSSQH